MNILRVPVALVLLLLVAACVTINVYFPAEAAEKAADLIIQDVYGKQPPADAGESTQPQSLNLFESAPAYSPHAWLDWLITPAHAEANISVNSPAIQQLKASMEKRHKQLAPYYNSGAIGMTGDGQITFHDQKLVPLKARNPVKSLVAKENRDRSALYAEIARANGHSEWETEIRRIFSKRWVSNAPGGWWYIDATGAWQQK